MKRLVVMLLLGAFVFGSVAVAMAAEQKSSQSTTKKAPAPQVTVKGTVVAAGKDAKGNVNAVAIRTEKGDYRVVLKGKGKELLKMVDKKVEATGTVREAKGKKSINISEFKEAGA